MPERESSAQVNGSDCESFWQALRKAAEGRTKRNSNQLFCGEVISPYELGSTSEKKFLFLTQTNKVLGVL